MFMASAQSSEKVFNFITTLILEELEVEMLHLAKLQLVTLVEILEGIFHSKQ
jgi:hypothetical protein